MLINRIINILKFGDGLESELAPDWATEDDLLFLTEYLTDPKPENRAPRGAPVRDESRPPVAGDCDHVHQQGRA